MKIAWGSLLFISLSVSAQQQSLFNAEAYRQKGNNALVAAAQPAALAGFDKTAFALFAERKYMIPGLNAMQLALALPLRKGTMGFNGSYLGLSGFRQWGLQLSYGRVLGQQLRVGVGLEASNVQAGTIPAAITLSPGLGMMVSLSESLACGIRVSRFWQTSLGEHKEEWDGPSYAFGCGWELSPQCFIGAELARTPSVGTALNAQLKYGFAPRLQASLGIETGSHTPWLSVGYRQGNWNIAVLNSLHPLLGYSPGLLLRYYPS